MFRTVSALSEMVFAVVAKTTQLYQRCKRLKPIESLIDFSYYILVSEKKPFVQETLHLVL